MYTRCTRISKNGLNKGLRGYNYPAARTVSAEYFVAMKLKSGRKYKNDLSDIVGILSEQKKNGAELGKAQIYSAIAELYGSADNIPKDSKTFIDNLLIGKNYDAVYEEIRSNEKDAKDILIEFEERYPDSLKTDNVDSILKTLKAKKQAEKDK